MASTLPTGTVTFLLTDLEGSTRLWEDHPTEMAAALARHDALIAAAVEAHDGRLLKTRGEGDSTFSVFEQAGAALAAAVDIQAAIEAESWPEPATVRVRAAVHTGEAEQRDGDYFGAVVNRAARLRSVAHGGQVLVSEAAARVAADSLPEGASLRDLGVHRLRDLARAERVSQLVHVSLRDRFPPLRSLDSRSNNLPVSLTTFIGRHRERIEVEKLVAEHRLVTLTGIGGAGKTRLALHVAADAVDEARDGVWFVELAPVSDGALVAATLASVLSVNEEPGRPIADTVSDALREREVLVVLDNCEHVVTEAAALADQVLRAGERVRILATSRQALGVPGEALYALRPLGMPGEDEVVTAEVVQEHDALRLFADRAALVRPDFALDDPAGIAEICRRLDGVPLAIELAAARMNVMTVAQLVARLDDRFPLLAAGSRTVEARQQTLRGAIDWSYDLLSSEEQRLFRRLSVFPGSVSLEAVEAVCGDTFTALAQLVDKSLVVADAGRFRMLETVRAYAADALHESGDEFEVHTGLLRWARAFVEASAGDHDALETEHDHLRAALGWALDGNDPAGGAELAVALVLFWDTRGHWSEGRTWLERAARVDGLNDPLRSDVLLAAAILALTQSDFAAADEFAGRALSIARPLLLHGKAALALRRQGDAAMQQGRFDEAEALLDDSRVEYRRAGDRMGAAAALATIGQLAHMRGDLAKARRCYDEALPHLSERSARVVRSNLGRLLRTQGDYAAARELAEEGLSEARSTGDRRAVAFALEELAKVLLLWEGATGKVHAHFDEALEIRRSLEDELGLGNVLYESGYAYLMRDEHDAAEARYSEALSIAERIGQPRLGVASLLGLGEVALARRDHDAATTNYLRALEAAESLDARLAQVECLDGMAVIASRRGEHVAAIAGWVAADRARRDAGSQLSPQEQARRETLKDEARGALGPEEFERLYVDEPDFELTASLAALRTVIARRE